MRELALRIVSTVGTIVTAGSVLNTAASLPIGAKISLGALILVALGVIVADIRAFLQNRPNSFELNSPKIRTYLVSWLKSGGRAAVFSRDLSWANDGHAARALESKAERGELLIFAGRHTPELERLAQKGAEIYDYSGLGFEPRSRFTIVDFGKTGERLAIGFQEGSKHAIYEYHSSDHAIMALASDLVALARASSNARVAG